MKTFICIIIGLGLFLLLYMWREAHRNRIQLNHLYFDDLPKAFHHYQLLFISDVHRRLVSLKVIHKLKGRVDLVLIGGDLCERGVPTKRIEENLKRLSALGPTFFVWGNNDEEIGRNELTKLLIKHNVVPLNNSAKIIEKEKESIAIGGVDDVGLRRDDVKKVIEESGTSFSILMSHYPEIIRKLPKPHPFRLVLSGHTHGGQIRLFGWGLREKGGIKYDPMYTHLISNGYGTSCLPLRLGAKAEMHLIKLEGKHFHKEVSDHT